MKHLAWYVALLSGAAVYYLVKTRSTVKPAPVEELARKLNEAWADHHTVV